jgi:serine/threonine-protein kinase
MSENKFGRYEIRGEIGRGGMSTVFSAYDPRFERDVAIKVLPHALLHDGSFRLRFEREAKMIALLEHPAIVPVYDFGEEDGQPYIVMRFMAGGSLKDRIEKGPMKVEEAAQIIARLAPALDVAHQKGIIHRDLKPGNILFDQYGNAFLSDFGIARLTHEPSAANLTQGAILGTPAYMSPEQIHGDKEIDGRADIYALGVILYEMITGSQPYKADTPGKVMMMHIMDSIPAARRVKTDVPAEVDTVISKSMAKDPDARFTTSQEMNAAVNEAIHMMAAETTISAKPAELDATIITPAISKPVSRPITPSSEKPSQPGKPPVSPSKAPPIKRGLSGIAIGGIIFLVLVGLLSIGGAAIFIAARNKATPTQLPPTTAVIAQASTHTPNVVLEPSSTFTLMPSNTPELDWTSTATLESTPEDTLTPTPTEPPAVLSIGGADKIAFISGNEVWVMNIDGSEPVQLTNDRIEKIRPRWTPDGAQVIFIAGKCIKIADALTTAVDQVVCFDNAEYVEAFEFSPDGTKIAVTVDHELYVIPYDLSPLKDIRSGRSLTRISTCPDIFPWNNKAFKLAVWGPDSQTLAVTFLAPVNGRLFEMIRIFDAGSCISNPAAKDEFPASRFTMSAYNDNPYIQSYSWNGTLFVLNSFRRNGGFGDLYIYNDDLHKLQTSQENVTYLNPIDAACCYRDSTWSPDGRYLLFAFQDIRQGADAKVQVYYIQYSEILPGAQFQPLNLPSELFPTNKEKPQFDLRPAK